MGETPKVNSMANKEKNIFTEIRINFTDKEIVVTKAFTKKISVYGSQEYKDFIEVQKNFPDFKVVEKATTKRTSSQLSKITLSDIKRYVSFHDDENKSKMAELERMCNAKANGELNSTSFFAIKKWFFEQYPEVA